jgi:hypothetical protein
MFYDGTVDPNLLWQGDVIKDFVVPEYSSPIVVLRDPPAEINNTVQFGGKLKHIKMLCDSNELTDAFSSSQEEIAITAEICDVAIISHSCDIDNKEFLTVAIVSPITLVTNLQTREDLKRWDRVFDKFYLPAEGQLEESYIDMNYIFSIPKEILVDKKGDRIVSMTSDYRTKFNYKLQQHFHRPD